MLNTRDEFLVAADGHEIICFGVGRDRAEFEKIRISAYLKGGYEKNRFSGGIQK